MMDKKTAIATTLALAYTSKHTDDEATIEFAKMAELVWGVTAQDVQAQIIRLRETEHVVGLVTKDGLSEVFRTNAEDVQHAVKLAKLKYNGCKVYYAYKEGNLYGEVGLPV